MIWKDKTSTKKGSTKTWQWSMKRTLLGVAKGKTHTPDFKLCGWVWGWRSTGIKGSRHFAHQCKIPRSEWLKLLESQRDHSGHHWRVHNISLRDKSYRFILIKIISSHLSIWIHRDKSFALCHPEIVRTPNAWWPAFGFSISHQSECSLEFIT